MALTIDDFCTPMFDRQRPVKRLLNARPEVEHLLEEDTFGLDDIEERYMMNPDDPDAEEAYMTRDWGPKKEPAIEGVTTTDNFHQVGFTYFLTDGMLYLNYLDKTNKKNIRLLEKLIENTEEFEKCIKRADKKIRKILYD